jgi:hypothetical protein
VPRNRLSLTVLISCEVEGVSTLHCTLDIGDDLLGAILWGCPLNGEVVINVDAQALLGQIPNMAV